MTLLGLVGKAHTLQPRIAPAITNSSEPASMGAWGRRQPGGPDRDGEGRQHLGRAAALQCTGGGEKKRAIKDQVFTRMVKTTVQVTSPHSTSESLTKSNPICVCWRAHHPRNVDLSQRMEQQSAPPEHSSVQPLRRYEQIDIFPGQHVVAMTGNIPTGWWVCHRCRALPQSAE